MDNEQKFNTLEVLDSVAGHILIEQDGSRGIATVEDGCGGNKELHAHRLVDCWNFLSAHPDLSKVEVVSKEKMERDNLSWLELDKANSKAFAKIEQLRASHAVLEARIKELEESHGK